MKVVQAVSRHCSMEECLETAKKGPAKRDLAENRLWTLLFGSNTIQTPSMAPYFVPNVDF